MSSAAQPKIFKKYEIVESGGHHGGGWKVAYADFMTAMMAFFLLMWILASSDEQKLRGIAEYFTNATLPGGSGVLDGATLGPPGVLTASNGAVVARGSELGKIDDPTPAQWEVRDVTNTSDVQNKRVGHTESLQEVPASGKSGESGAKAATTASALTTDFSEKAAAAAQAETREGTLNNAGQTLHQSKASDRGRFEALRQDLKQAMQESPELQAIAENVIFEETPEGLSIQIIDQEGKPMFSSGRANITSAFGTLLNRLGQSLAYLPNDIVLEGHTDAVPFTVNAGYDNWDLSADRANATRRAFKAAGVQDSRFLRVSGLADTDPLVPEKPNDASNRRITILVQYQDHVPAPAAAPAPASIPTDDADLEKTGPMPASKQAASKSVQMQAETAQEQLERVAHNLRSALR